MTQAVAAIAERLPKNAPTFPPPDLWSDEPPLERDLHRDPIDRLIRLIRWAFRDRQDVYMAVNLTVSYSPHQKKSEDFTKSKRHP